MTIHIIYENEDWMPPIREAFRRASVPYQDHFTGGGTLDVLAAAPPGIYYNRMSPSSHTRGNQAGLVYARELFSVLEAQGRRVINGSRALSLELSKVAQHAALQAAGIRTPRTLAVVGGPAALRTAARQLATPFITKDNQGGKGLGVRLFREVGAFDDYVESPEYQPGPDGVTLLQQYVEAAEPFITRVEIVDGRFLYALRSSTVGGFELCPADACAVDDAFCPVGDTGMFSLDEELTAEDPLVLAYLRLCGAHGLDIAGIEYVTDADGLRWTYDVNANTNYNGALERSHGLSGMDAVAGLCKRLLAEGAGAAAGQPTGQAVA